MKFAITGNLFFPYVSCLERFTLLISWLSIFHNTLNYFLKKFSYCSILLETEPQAIISRCALRSDDLIFGDQTISQVGMSVSLIEKVHETL